MTDALTPDQEAIVRKCADPRYWIERCLSIVDKSADTKLVPFLFNPVQADYYAKRTKRDIIVKARKQGFSTLMLAIFLHACVYRKNTRAVVVSHEEDATLKLFGRLKQMLKDSIFPIRTKKDSESEISFPDTNSIFYIGTAGSKKFGRGADITHAHLSEVAHYEDQSITTAVEGALVDGAWFTMETTANGAGTPFHAHWTRAIEERSEWKPHFYGWQQDPNNIRPAQDLIRLNDEEQAIMRNYDLTKEQVAWRRWKIGSMPQPEFFPQEFPISWREAFMSSGRMLFDAAALEQQDRTKLPVKWQGHIVDRGREIRLEDDPKGPLRVWRTPTDQSAYIIIADAADGIPGEAYSVADVFDMRSWEQVAQWHGHCPPNEFGDVLERLGAFYNWAILFPENMYPGNAVIQKLVDDAYPNIMADPDGKDGSLGFKTDQKTKAIYISDGRDAVKQLDIKINSPITLSEMQTFCLIDGKMQPQAGCWQDTVITASKGASILKRLNFNPERIEQERKHQMRFKERVGRSGRGTIGVPRFRSTVV